MPKRLRRHYLYAEPLRRLVKCSYFESNQGVSLPINRRFQNHLVIRIAQLWPPRKVPPDGPDDARKIIENGNYLGFRSPGSVEVLLPRHDRLILRKESNAGEHFMLLVQARHKKASRCALRASHGCDHHVGIQNQPHHISRMMRLPMTKIFMRRPT
jgi:hypothetical protein